MSFIDGVVVIQAATPCLLIAQDAPFLDILGLRSLGRIAQDAAAHTLIGF